LVLSQSAPGIASSSRQVARVILRLTLLGTAIALGVLAFGGVILFNSRQDAWSKAEHAANNLVLALSRDITRNIKLYDLSLQGAIETVSHPELALLSPQMRQLALFDNAATAEYLGALVLVNADGNIFEDSTSIPPHNINLADREHFQVHRQNPDAGLFISRPVIGRLNGGEWMLSLSRRISAPDGSFAGVAMGAMRLAYFKDLFANLDLGSSGSVTLFRADGRVIMRLPFRESDIDRDLGGTPLFKRYSQSAADSLVDKATLDNVVRLYSFRHLPGLPLILSVAVAVDDIYADWWRKALGIGSVLLLLCGATISLCHLFRREMLRRLKAEADLVEAANRLSTIAATDALTGLMNRRALNERLSQEWRRATRSATSIALLMIDADHFKNFNDHYGHLEGDEVLRRIATSIAPSLLRPADFAARFGGEEFIVLLSETDFHGALVVAERIRAAVADLAVPHVHGRDGVVTVSIGVAVSRPTVGSKENTLIVRADAALYQAKHAGRNCVWAADETKEPAIDWQYLEHPAPHISTA
jgi:diguanylate cyclase (GGDEF)-like protein